MKKYNKQFIFIPILMIVSLFTMLQACKKSDTTYHEYENKIQEFDGDAMSYLESAPVGVYDSILVVINRLPNVEDALRSQELTVFALTNKSFQIAVRNLNVMRKLENKAPIYLADADVEELDTMICQYLIKDARRSEYFKNFSDGLLVKSLKDDYPMHILYSKANASGFVGGGPQILTFSDPKNSIFVKFWQRTPTDAVNIVTNNAIVNIIASDHEFGFNEFTSRLNK